MDKQKSKISLIADSINALWSLSERGELDPDRAAFQALFNVEQILNFKGGIFFDFEAIRIRLDDNAATLKGIELQLDELVKGFRPPELTEAQLEQSDKVDRQYSIQRIAIELLKAGAVDFRDVPLASTKERCDLLYTSAEQFYNRFFLDSYA